MHTGELRFDHTHVVPLPMGSAARDNLRAALRSETLEDSDVYVAPHAPSAAASARLRPPSLRFSRLRLSFSTLLSRLLAEDRGSTSFPGPERIGLVFFFLARELR